MVKGITKSFNHISYTDLMGILLFLSGIFGFIFPFAKVQLSAKGPSVFSTSYSIFLYEISAGDGKLDPVSDVLLVLTIISLIFSFAYVVSRIFKLGPKPLQLFLIVVSSLSFTLNVYLISSIIESLFEEPWYLDSFEFTQFQQVYSVSISYDLVYYFSWLTIGVFIFAPFRSSIRSVMIFFVVKVQKSFGKLVEET